ncbi:MAG: hydantoinase/oxoprolinase family protein [Armatimonadetes bacterium]|nr:hydantoinase/oxoprolinase family protein [Armatimonadota bacterium]
MTAKRGQSRYLLGFDIGGTFTDFVLLDVGVGTFWVHKVLTTPQDPSKGALEGIRALLAQRELRAGDVAVIIHGTTLVANSLIEHRGAKTGLLTTQGFRDILAMGKEQRYDIYDLFLKFPEPLVPRKWRRGIVERIDRTGQVLAPLDVEMLEREVRGFVAQGVESVALCFLHGYANPAHEKQAAAAIAARFPGLSVSTSNEVASEVREYERTATTCANAYVRPLFTRYVGGLERAFTDAGFTGQFYLMQSSGGTATPQVARDLPIRLVESGPAAGALAAALIGHQIGRSDLVSFDMGGTTAKACLIDGGAPTVTASQEVARVHRFKRGSGIPVKAPTIDMIEIGAGGGSIARVSSLGLLKVGPDSAGADPGPACYGRGGHEPTVTDANLLLGYLNPNYFLGGRMSLDVDAARAAVGALAEKLRMDTNAAAYGIHSIVNENMSAAARVHIIERGRDPRGYGLVAFGGAGPLHACAVGRIIGAPEVILPIAAGAASALGLLIAPLAFDYVRSYPGLVDDLDLTKVNGVLHEMEEAGLARLAEAGIHRKQARVVRFADMRLHGQFHEITVPVPAGELTKARLPELKAAFAEEYKRVHSHLYEGVPMMGLTWRVRVEGPRPEVALSHDPRTSRNGDRPAGDPRKGERHAYFPGHGFVATPVYDRYKLPVGFASEGPAIIEEHESTAIIHPGDAFSVDARANMVVKLAKR